MHRSSSVRSAALAALVFAVVGLAGCSARTDVAMMPGLSDLVADSPAGRKCYDHCAQYRATCRRMCPSMVGECEKDCENESKHCLAECPDLRRVTPVPEKK